MELELKVERNKSLKESSSTNHLERSERPKGPDQLTTSSEARGLRDHRQPISSSEARGLRGLDRPTT